MQNKLFTYFQRSSTETGQHPKAMNTIKQESLPENKDLNQRKSRAVVDKEETPQLLKGGFTNGMSELKTGLAGIPTGEKKKASTQIFDDESSEELVGVRGRRSGTQKKRAYIDDEDEEFDEEELKGCVESEEEADSYLDESSDSYVKKKKKPAAKKAPPQSAPPQKRQQSMSELKKRPSEITQQPETEQSLYVDKEDEFIGGGFASLDEIKEARPSFIKE